MPDIDSKAVYFEEKGAKNTDKVLKIAKERARELGIKSIIVATTGGDTGIKAARFFKDCNIIVVTHSTGFSRPDVQELSEENRKIIEAQGGKILTCLHAFGGIGRAVRKKFSTYELDDIIAASLRIFGEGTKVACEITLMASDAGLVRSDEEVIAIAGTDRGADTAVVIKPANVQRFFDLRVKEILCKPRS